MDTIMTEPALSRELARYQQLLPELTANEGKFALIFGDDLLGVFASYEDALTAGYEKAGLAPFLVKRINAVESVAFFSRDLTAPCRT
jgi:hypothetical protein